MNWLRDHSQDTICAQSTASGEGAIAVVRVSGPKALVVTRSLAAFLPEFPESHKIYFGYLKSRSNQDLDQVLVSYFKQGHSFTGEETLEINCHGSAALVNQVLAELIYFGARAADRGEFTFRAFMNGKIDLVQAESVLALIQSQSLEMAFEAGRQLKGGLSVKLEEIEKNVLFCLAHLEANIDFSEENIQSISPTDLARKGFDIAHEIRALVTSFERGNILAGGCQVAIVGMPNAGKSSLFNLLAREERAIVTEVPGTTRDSIEFKFNLGGRLVSFIDTAGIRQAAETIEKKGIEKTFLWIDRAHLIFYVVDSGLGLQEGDLEILKKIDLSKVILIFNKSDLIADHQLFADQMLCWLEISGIDSKLLLKPGFLLTSALNESDLNVIEQWLTSTLVQKTGQEPTIVQRRHFELLVQALEKIEMACTKIIEGESPEISAFFLYESLSSIHQIQGKSVTDDVLDRIFKEFCIGK